MGAESACLTVNLYDFIPIYRHFKYEFIEKEIFKKYSSKDKSFLDEVIDIIEKKDEYLFSSNENMSIPYIPIEEKEENKVSINFEAIHEVYFSIFKEIILPFTHNFVSKLFKNGKFYKKYIKPYVKVVSEHKIQGNILNHIQMDSICDPFNAGFKDFIETDEYSKHINDIHINLMKKFKSNRQQMQVYTSSYTLTLYLTRQISLYSLFLGMDNDEISDNKEFYEFSNDLIDDLSEKFGIIVDEYDEDLKIKEISNYFRDSLKFSIVNAIRYSIIYELIQILKNSKKYKELNDISLDINMFFTKNIKNLSLKIEYLKQIVEFLNTEPELMLIEPETRAKLKEYAVYLSKQSGLIDCQYIEALLSDYDNANDKNDKELEEKTILSTKKLLESYLETTNTLIKQEKEHLNNIFNFNIADHYKYILEMQWEDNISPKIAFNRLKLYHKGVKIV